MDFEPGETQAAIVDGLERLIASLKIEAPREARRSAFSAALDHELAQAGFLTIAREDGFSLLDAALIVERVARLPVSAEAAASALIGPLWPEDRVPRPIALARGSPSAPARFLPQARSLLVDRGDDILLIRLEGRPVETLDTLFAYPFGRLTGGDEPEGLSLGDGTAALRRRWRLALAVEAAGLMRAALDCVVDQVRTRHQFGRPIGSFQAVQHRLAMAAACAEATRWLAFQAAWSDDETHCAVAATYAQQAIPRLTYDLHQFCGAMGLTLEFPLHHWTYRLKALLGELGGPSAQARAAAAAAWPRTA